jgi:hypothetical protein
MSAGLQCAKKGGRSKNALLERAFMNPHRDIARWGWGLGAGHRGSQRDEYSPSITTFFTGRIKLARAD